jgi:uncharacterized protein YidB (DUF937 family)
MDDLSKMLGTIGDTGSTGGLDPTKLGDLAKAVQDEGGLDDLVGKLQGAGMGGTVDTWVGSGPNESIDPQRLGAALGDDEVQRLSAKSGLDIASLLPLLAAFLPQIINMLTPKGQVPDGGLNDAAQQQMPDLGGMLGGLLGGAAGSGGTAGDAGLDDLLGGLGGTLGGDKGR